CRACFFCRVRARTPKTGRGPRAAREGSCMPVARPLAAVLLLLLVGGLAAGQGPDDWLFPPGPVTAGDPEVSPSLWQRTWGVAGLSAYPYGHKMAPNGVAYQPLFDLDLLLNVGLTPSRSVYLFSKAHFWA